MDAPKLDPCGRDGPAYTPDNVAFRRHHMGNLLHRVGALLPRWLGGQELIDASRHIEQTCWRDLGYPTEPIFDGDLPLFLLVRADGSPIKFSIPTEPVELAACMAMLEPSPLPKSSLIGTNFAALARLLNLTPFELQWLRWSYCVRHFGPGILPNLAISGEERVCEALALLSDVPVDIVRDTVAARRLYVLGLLDSPGRHDLSSMSLNLNDWLCATYEFAAWIVQPYATDADVLAALCQANISLSASL